MNKFWRISASLRLTIILLFLSMVLVFFGTLDQVRYGIYEVQKRYFESFFVAWYYPQEWPLGTYLKSLFLPMPGGFFVGLVLVFNLICAHFKYFQLKLAKLGIMLIHLGVLMLVVSGFLSAFLQDESQMWLTLGDKKSYSESRLENELVLIDKSRAVFDEVYSIPQKSFDSLLKKPVSIPGTPFRVRMKAFYPNGQVGLREKNRDAPETLATKGVGKRMNLAVFPSKTVFGEEELNTATGYVEVLTQAQESLGIWLVSNVLDERFPPQTFQYDGNRYEIALRFKRTYFPFTFELIEFKNENYPGTSIPKNYSSLLAIESDSLSEGKGDAATRQALIYMNHPLRYKGYTFYQASYSIGPEIASVLQVVKNPLRWLPYMSVYMVGLGLVFHFFLYLVKYLKKNFKTCESRA